MAGITHIDILPRRGRGLNEAGNQFNELWDSFAIFEHLYIHPNGWWQTRPDDLTLDSGLSLTPRNFFIFNRVVDSSGTINSSILVVADSTIKDGGGSTLTTAFDPFEIYFESVKNRVYWAGANNPPKIWTGATLGLGVSTWGAVGPTGNLASLPYTFDSPDTKVKIGTAGVSAASPNVTSAAQFTAGSAWVGKTILLDDVPYTIQTVPTASTMTLTTNYAGAVPPSSVPFIVHYGSRSWTVAPRYAYAYYNPTTGHVTNRSPVLRLSESQMTNVAVYISGVASNPTLNGYGYTKIVIFRTAEDGSSLLPLKLPVGVGDSNGFLNNTGAPQAFQDELGDEQLGLILGLYEAPIENDPAPNMKCIAYFDGRFWGIEQDRPWILRYSGDSGQIPLGVPEECWPARNFRQISSSDGYGTGLKVIGTTLMVFTERYAYSVAPGGDGDYRLERVSTRGFGVSQLGVAEHPGDSSEASASAIYVGRDRKLWRHFPGGRIEEIGKPIQSYLDTVEGQSTRRPFLTYIFMANNFWFLVLGISAFNAISGFTGYNVLLYDFDQEAWYDWGYFDLLNTHDLVADAAGYVNPGDGKAYLGMALQSQSGEWRNTYIAMGSSLSTSNTAVMQTHPLDFGAMEVKKSLESVELYVGDPTQTFTVEAAFDGINTFYPMTQLDLSNTPRSKGFGVQTFVLQEVRQFTTLVLKITFPQGIGQERLYKIRPYVTPESVKQSGGEP